MKLNYIIAVALFIFMQTANAAYLNFIEQTVIQPDGTELNIFASGDEFYHWLHDKDGYTIVKNPVTGYFTYADKRNNEIIPTAYIPGKTLPEAVGLTPWIKPSKEVYQLKVERFSKDVKAFRQKRAQLKSSQLEPYHIGKMNNIMIFITFKDGPAIKNSLSYYDKILNSDSKSMYAYYKEVSYDQLAFTTHFFPNNTDSSITLSYKDPNVRGYYSPYDQSNTSGYFTDQEQYDRRRGLLKNALNSVRTQIPKSIVLDKDNDGFIDNLSFIVQGIPDGWGDLIWPHMSSFGDMVVTVNGVKAGLYTFQMESTRVTTFCHEMFHMLGAPDLYHYKEEYNHLSPVGNWDLMESGKGHMSAQMKYRYAERAWISNIPSIDSTGTYTLYPLLSKTKNCYQIKAKKFLKTQEYFVLEYRKKVDDTFENYLTGSGLLLYRINGSYEGNAQGPPDEIYLYRPYGTTDSNGSISFAPMSNIPGMAVSDDSPISAFLSDGTPSGLRISQVSEAGDSITFRVDLDQSDAAQITSFQIIEQAEPPLIDSIAGTIHVKLLRETDINNIRPVVQISDYATVSPASNLKVDLTNPVVYTVKAEDGTIKKWTVTAEILPSKETQFKTFSLLNLSCTVSIDKSNNVITVQVPFGTSLNHLIPTAEISIGASIFPDTLQAFDFSNPVTFNITSEDLEHVAAWKVNVLVDTAPNYKLDDLVEVTTKNGSINITSFQDDLLYSLYSLNGSKLKTGNINGTTQIVLEGIPGVYILELKNELGRMIKKIRLNMN